MISNQVKIISVSEPIEEVFTRDSITWCNLENIEQIDVVEREKTVIVTLDNNEVRRYGYCDSSSIAFNSEINLNFTYVKDFQIDAMEVNLSSIETFFDGDTIINDCLIMNKKLDFVRSIFNGYLIFRELDFDMTRVFLNEVISDIVVFKNSIIRCHLSLKARQVNHIIFNGCIVHGTSNMDVIDYKNLEGLSFYKTRLLGQIYMHWNNDIRDALVHGNIVNIKHNDISTSRMTNKQIADQLVLLKENFHNLGQYQDEDSTYIEFKRFEAKSKLEIRKREGIISSVIGYVSYVGNRLLFDLVGGYGTKPTNVFLTMIIVWLSFAGIYAWFPAIELGFSDSIHGIDKIRPLYFSVITFLTIGYGDVSPLNDTTALLAMIEGFLGIFLMSYFTVSFVRKLLR